MKKKGKSNDRASIGCAKKVMRVKSKSFRALLEWICAIARNIQRKKKREIILKGLCKA